MAIPVNTLIDQQEVQKRVEQVRQHLGEDVIAIRYDLDTDWAEDPAIHFRVLLSDAVGNNRQRLADVTEHVMDELVDKLGVSESGRYPYFNFRSQSEQAEFKDPEWD